MVGVHPVAPSALAVGDERRAAGRQHAERAAAERDRALRVAPAHGDLRRRELQLLHHELAVEVHARAVDLLPEAREQLARGLVHDLGADLLEDRHGLRVDGVERVLGEDRERRLEHAADSD